MVKKKSLAKKSNKILSNQLLILSAEFCAWVLLIAFLACIIVYINKINQYHVIDIGSDNRKSVKSINRSLQMFIYVMAWVILIVMGLSAIKKTNIF